MTNLIIKKSVLLILLLTNIYFVFSQAIIDQNGWTQLDVDTADKIIYISSSEGVDQTGEVYLFPNNLIGENPIFPTERIRPFRTIEAAMTSVADGESVWILLKRGDTFYESITPKSGKSNQAPIIITSYGNFGESPILKTGDQPGIAYCCRGLKNFWVIGLEFYAHTRNPNDEAYENDEGKDGFNLFVSEGYELSNILIEGNKFRFYRNNIIQGRGIIKNITLRRNMILDNYSTNSHSQGLFGNNIQGILLEENIFDHNGWLIPAEANLNDPSSGKATIFNHNTYFSDSKNVRFINNSFHRASSIGNKWTANQGPASSSNIQIENNLYNDCEIGISIGGNEYQPSYRFKNISIKENVITDLGKSRQTNRTLGWGIDIDDWDRGICSFNYVLSQKEDSVRNGIGIRLKGENRNVNIRKNILRSLKNTDYIVVDSNILDTIKIFNNELSENLSNNYFVNLTSSLNNTSSISGNFYENSDENARLFKYQSVALSNAEWNEQNSIQNDNFKNLEYLFPNRDLDAYISQILNLNTRKEFYEKLREQSYLKWNPELTAPIINKWIKEGFQIDQSSNGVDDIFSINGSETVLPGNNYDISVDYEASTNREIIVLFQQNRAPWTIYGQKKIDVTKGKGLVNINIDIDSSTPVASNEYKWTSFIVPIGGDFDNNLSIKQKVDISTSLSPSANNIWYLENKPSKQWLGVNNCSLSNSGSIPLVLVANNGNDECNVFEFIPSDGEYFFIQNQFTKGRYRSQNCSNTVDDSIEIVQVGEGSFGWCEQWRLVDAGEGFYRIENRQTGGWIRSKGCNGTIGTSITQVDTSYSGDCTKWKLIDAGIRNRESEISEAVDKGVSFYPNPASNELILRVDTSLKEIRSIKIYDLQGRVAKEISINGLKEDTEKSIDVSGITEGLYILSIDFIKKETQNVRFIIKH